MLTGDRLPDARPIFRKLALGLAIVLFVLAGLFFFSPGLDRVPSYVCLAVGFIMLVIGKTGYWPPRR